MTDSWAMPRVAVKRAQQEGGSILKTKIAGVVLCLSLSTNAWAQGGPHNGQPLACFETPDGGSCSPPDSGTGGGGSQDAGTNCRLVQVVHTTTGSWSVWPPNSSGTTTVTNTYQCGP